MADTSLEMRLALDAARWHRDWRRAEQTTEKSTRGMRRQVDSVGNILRDVRGQLAAVGVAFSVTRIIGDSARLDKSLIGVKQTAGATKEQADELRESLFEMSGETGQAIDGLKGGFDALIQSGLDWSASMATIPEINKAMAVSGSQAEILAGALSVAGEAFQFDLSKPGLALDLLDKMVVAGRLGNAELEDLSDIFGRVGVNAKRANLGFEQTLGFVEQLSLIERKPERLATLADSTLRIFTSERYKQMVANATGVDFYDENQASRDPLDVLDDIAEKYKLLTTDAKRNSFIQAAFGKTDEDTRKGLGALLAGDALTNMRAMVGHIEGATGTIARDLPDALKNSIDQAGRLKAVMREAADEFVGPVNKIIADVIQKGLDSKEKGGLGLSGTDIAIGAGVTVGGLLLGKKYGGKLMSRFSGGALNTAQGVAIGKSLETAAGVTPVYVVNMPGAAGFAPGLPGPGMYGPGAIGEIIDGVVKKGGPAGMASRFGLPGLAVAGAGLAGWGGGTLLHAALIKGTKADDIIGDAITEILAFLGIDEAKATLHRNQKYKSTMAAFDSGFAGTRFQAALNEAINRTLDMGRRDPVQVPFKAEIGLKVESTKDHKVKVDRMPDTRRAPFDIDVYNGPAMNSL